MPPHDIIGKSFDRSKSLTLVISITLFILFICVPLCVVCFYVFLCVHFYVMCFYRMQFEDYCQHFTKMAICRVVNTSFFSMRKKWHESIHHSEWTKPARSGGCINNKETFLNNPQVSVLQSTNII